MTMVGLDTQNLLLVQQRHIRELREEAQALHFMKKANQRQASHEAPGRQWLFFQTIHARIRRILKFRQGLQPVEVRAVCR